MLQAIADLFMPVKTYIIEMTLQDDSGQYYTKRLDYPAEVWEKVKPVYDRHFNYVAYKQR